MFKPHFLIAALAITTASIALDASIATKPASAGFGIGIGAGFGFGRRAGFGFGTSIGPRSSFGVGIGVGRPYRYGYPYFGTRVLINGPYYPYYPNAVYPSVIVAPNGYYSPGYACGTTIYGSSIPSPILVNPYTGLACP